VHGLTPSPEGVSFALTSLTAVASGKSRGGDRQSAGMLGTAYTALRIREHHDLVQLRRRIRTSAEELGIDGRAGQLLPSSAFQLARVLLAETGSVEAELRTTPTHLDIVLLAECGDPVCVARVDSALNESTIGAPLEVRRDGTRVTAVLSAVLPERRDEGRTVALDDSTVHATADTEASVQRLVRELQLELEETNRGVVALYAELDDQAERLRQAEDRFRVLLDSVHDYAICMLDTNGEVVSWNAGAERLFGYTADDIVGRSFACFYTAQDRDLDLPAEHLATAAADGRVECECLRVRQGGSAFDAEVLLTSLRGADGALRGYTLVVRDTTVRRRLEDDLRRRADDLASANRAKEEFLATLSHELRTPLNAMLGWTRLLRMGKLEGPAMARALETIERNARIQEQLIADILDVSRIVTGKLRITARPMELSSIVEPSLDAVRPAADAKGLHLVADVGPSGPVLGDADRLQQVVWNLLANAIKFTASGGRVSLTVARVGPNAVVTVSDTGEGISPELLPYVFDRFRQGDASATRPHGGLGLGLSIVRQIVELHGGHVQAWSEGPGRGSTFSVHLPVRAIQEQAVSRETVSTPLAGVKVLVVDDDPDAREVVATALAQCGAKTAAAGSAREGLQVLMEFRPHVLVSDIGMPGEDGYAFIRRVRQLPEKELGTIPAVALTGFVHADARRRALGAGYQRFVPKPVEVDELAAVVRTLLS
jgi:PAS domain S-box-containing protein